MNATQTYQQAFRTICTPHSNSLKEAFIPNEYIGQKLEVIVFPQYEEPDYNEETLAAMQEADDIASGKIKAKSYSNHRELVAEIEAEIAAEGNN
ncbi:MAG: hypothetical protein FWC15_00505 [Fibromonadales bacterium]|nr:hypothetical protein [Fibromonadales bacterium]